MTTKTPFSFIQVLARVSLCAGLAIAPIAATQAELPPDAYAQMKRNALAVATVEVVEVQVGKRRGTAERGYDTGITVRARVLTVERGIGLSAGQIITIRYDHFTAPGGGWSGARPIRILKKGERVRAWLHPASRIGWRPAARGASFARLK